MVIAERLGVTLNMSVLGQKKLFPWDKVISRYRSADLSLSEKHFFCACTATNGSIFPLVILRYKNSYTAMFSKMPVRDTFVAFEEVVNLCGVWPTGRGEGCVAEGLGEEALLRVGDEVEGFDYVFGGALACGLAGW